MVGGMSSYSSEEAADDTGEGGPSGVDGRLCGGSGGGGGRPAGEAGGEKG